jgi:hypothetical protein
VSHRNTALRLLTQSDSLIAIMLGRLRMSVDECIDAYVKLMERVFKRRENISFVGFLGGVKPRFSSDGLKEAIIEVLKERKIAPDELFENGQQQGCKV